MKVILEKRTSPSRWMAVLSPFIALALTVLASAIGLSVADIDPAMGLYMLLVDPLTAWWSVEELIVKATPLIIIGAGLSLSYRANVWNIGAEGQLTIGALFGSALPVLYPEWQSFWILPLMVLLGATGGALYGAIPAFLKSRFQANEILSSLMLVYVAQLTLDWFVRGPWRDPDGYNFPRSASFEGWQLLPTLGDSRVHIGIWFAMIVVLVLKIILNMSLKGFELKIVGSAPRAATFAGFSINRTLWFSFLTSGALAGTAGIFEVAGPMGNLQPTVSPGYGFTAIIVAFLGRLDPISIVFAALLLALSYLGGEAAQIALGISEKLVQVFQGGLLISILACNSLILYRIRFSSRKAEGAIRS